MTKTVNNTLPIYHRDASIRINTLTSACSHPETALNIAQQLT